MSRYYTKIHIQTGCIDGYIEKPDLERLQSAFDKADAKNCSVNLRNGTRYDAPVNCLNIKPSEIIAIEYKWAE